MSFYITTPIYYVNGKPHIGHAYTTISADAAARYQRMKGVDTRFLTGTDEHGQKVLEAAQARGLSPKAHCDEIVRVWKQMMSDLDISYDRFIRTTDPDHIAVVQAVLHKLFDQGLIYKDSYTGWYSTAAERFWTEKDLVDGRCPDTGQPVQEITETNYFFRMSKYQQQLIDHIQTNPGFIQPESRKNEVLGFLRQELGDLCISRPKSRMSWGIEIPFDPDYVTYVWFDALLNYLTGVGYHPDRPSEDFATYWPADYHLVGKDILTTHAVYWSTMLFAMGVAPMKSLYAHGWWVASDGSKMSKSLGNVIDVFLLTRVFGVDAVRYFFLRDIRFGADGGFTYEGFLTRYNADLANDLGNLVHRGLSMTTNWLGGVVPELGPRTAEDEVLTALAADVLRRFDAEMEALQFNKALEAVFELVGAGNKYVDEQKPWALNKAGDAARCGTVLRHVLEIAFFAASLLSAVTPRKSEELLAKLGRTPEQAKQWLGRALVEGADLRALPAGRPLDLGEPLFPRHREMPAEILALAAEPEPPPAPEPRPIPVQESVRDDGLIGFEDFQKVQLRAGQIVAAEDHPDASRLLVLKVDVGEAEPRTVVAGIKARFEAADLVGRTVVVVVNLQPAKLRGIESQGMLLAAGGKDVVDLVSVNAEPGTIVR